jgi:hypothetical protein
LSFGRLSAAHGKHHFVRVGYSEALGNTADRLLGASSRFRIGKLTFGFANVQDAPSRIEANAQRDATPKLAVALQRGEAAARQGRLHRLELA